MPRDQRPPRRFPSHRRPAQEGSKRLCGSEAALFEGTPGCCRHPRFGARSPCWEPGRSSRRIPSRRRRIRVDRRSRVATPRRKNSGSSPCSITAPSANSIRSSRSRSDQANSLQAPFWPRHCRRPCIGAQTETCERDERSTECPRLRNSQEGGAFEFHPGRGS